MCSCTRWYQLLVAAASLGSDQFVMAMLCAADASGSGKKRRPLDAGLTGDQLRHARKRRLKETAPAVKDMLKPMYATKALDKVRHQRTVFDSCLGRRAAQFEDCNGMLTSGRYTTPTRAVAWHEACCHADVVGI